MKPCDVVSSCTHVRGLAVDDQRGILGMFADSMDTQTRFVLFYFMQRCYGVYCVMLALTWSAPCSLLYLPPVSQLSMSRLRYAQPRCVWSLDDKIQYQVIDITVLKSIVWNYTNMSNSLMRMPFTVRMPLYPTPLKRVFSHALFICCYAWQWAQNIVRFEIEIRKVESA